MWLGLVDWVWRGGATTLKPRGHNMDRFNNNLRIVLSDYIRAV